MIHLLKKKTTSSQIQEMLQEYEDMLKVVVDIRRRFLSGGGEMHSDCESTLLEDGSEQDDLWGANWYPSEQRIEFESLFNIRPRLGNRNILIQDENLRKCPSHAEKGFILRYNSPHATSIQTRQDYAFR